MGNIYKGGTPFTKPAIGFAPVTSAGWDVLSTKAPASVEKTRLGSSLDDPRRNVELHNGSEYVRFFCDAIEMNFALKGETAQGRYVMDFYAHNIEIPAVAISCETLNQEEYGNIIEFIHDSQRKAVEGKTLLQVHVAAGGTNIRPKNRLPGFKGAHQEILAKGFIESTDRVHERWVYKTDQIFEFTIAEMNNSGVYTESSERYPEQKTYAEILASLIDNSTNKIPNVEEEKVKTVVAEVNRVAEILGEGF